MACRPGALRAFLGALAPQLLLAARFADLHLDLGSARLGDPEPPTRLPTNATEQVALLEFLEESAQKVTGPKFFAEASTWAVQHLFSESLEFPPPCGRRRLVTLEVASEYVKRIAASPETYFGQNAVVDWDDKNHKVLRRYVAVKKGPHWEETWWKDFWFLDGQELVGIEAKGLGDKPTTVAELKEMLSKIDEGEKAALYFESGVDLRACWANIEDLDGKPVCGHELISTLMRDMQDKAVDKEASDDKLGMSGSTIVGSFPGWIIKNVKNMKEYDMMAAAFPRIGQAIRDRIDLDGACYRTGITPICGVFFGAQGKPWVIMRAVGIPGAEEQTIDLKGDKVEKFDLKSPKFADSQNDGKQYWKMSREAWHRKESGFVRIFPNGVTMEQCGARDFNLALDYDAWLLEELKMTDYSLYATMYKQPPNAPCGCGGSAPRWPLIIDVAAKGKNPAVRFAFGIIDYIEQHVNREAIKSGYSTMREPDLYRSWWLLMFPQFFRVPQYSTEKSSISDEWYLLAWPEQKHEKFFIGQRIRAVMMLTWSSKTMKKFITFWSDDGSHEEKIYPVHYSKVLPSSAKVVPSSNFARFAGKLGTIVNFEKSNKKDVGYMVFVTWDGLEGKVFSVYPWEIYGEPRVFV